MAEEGDGQVGCRCLELGPDLLFCGPVGYVVHVGYVGDDPRVGGVLGGFHHRVARRITRRQPLKCRDGVLIYPPLEDAMAELALQELETYVSRYQNIFAQFIVIRPIMDLYLAAGQRPGPWVSKRQW